MSYSDRPKILQNRPMKSFSLLLLCAASFHCYAESYQSAVQSALDAEPALCLGETRWPVIIAKGRDGWLTARMAALADAGLIARSATANETVWRLTDYGGREFRRHHDFCYGQMRVKHIQSVTAKEAGQTEVIFTYDIAHLPAWANNKAVRVANNDLDNLLMGVDKVRWRVSFSTATRQVVAEPEQLDLLY